MMVYKCKDCGEMTVDGFPLSSCPLSQSLAIPHNWQELDQGVAIVMLFRTIQTLAGDVERLQYGLIATDGRYEEQLCDLRREVAAAVKQINELKKGGGW